MSYVFNGVNSLLNEDQQNQNQGTNIFDPQQTGNQQGQPDAQAGGEQQPKTSTEGEVGGNGPTGSGQAAESKPQAQAQVADTRLMRKNQVKDAPKFAKDAQGTLAEAQTNLQNEADSYLKGQQKDYSVQNADIEKAIGGDTDASGKVTRVLSGTADKAQEFAPQTDYNVEDIDQMQTDAGLESLLRRNAGAEYTAGESAFDRSLLNRSAEFNQLRSLLKGQQDALNKQADSWSGAEGEKTKAAQKALEDNYAAARSGATGYLEGQSKTLTAAQQKEVDDWNKAKAALAKSGDKKYVDEQSKAVLDQLISEFKAGNGNPADLKYLTTNGIDLSKYFGVGADARLEDAIDENEAKRFNSIMGLLGKEDNWSAGGGLKDARKFDSATLKSLIQGNAKTANTKADREAQAMIDRINASVAQQKADEVAYREKMKSSGNTLGGSDAATVEKIRNSLKAEYGGDASLSDLFNNWGSLVNAGDFVNYNDVNADPNAWLSASDAEALNKAYEEIGSQNRVTAGSGAGPRSTFDSGGYEAALRALLNGRKASNAVGSVSVNPNFQYEVATRPVKDLEKAKKAKIPVKDPTGRRIKV